MTISDVYHGHLFGYAGRDGVLNSVSTTCHGLITTLDIQKTEERFEMVLLSLGECRFLNLRETLK